MARLEAAGLTGGVTKRDVPTIISHPAIPLALGWGLGDRVISRRLLLAGVAMSAAPDLDVVTLRLGISYADGLGHRGFSHSLFTAALIGLVGACSSRLLRTTFGRAFWFLAVATGSHGVLDSFTNGGLGVAFLWPWSAERYFAPVRPIEVSPLSVRSFFADGGAEVLVSEVIWVWMPCAVVFSLLLTLRKTLRRSDSDEGDEANADR